MSKVQPAGTVRRRRARGSKTGVPIRSEAAPASSERQLYRAAQDGDIFAMKKLIGRGADVNARVGGQGGACVHVAASTGPSAGMLWLLANADGLDVNARTDSGFTALHFAAMRGHLKIARLLVERGGADPMAANALHKFPVEYLDPKMAAGRDLFELLEHHMKQRLSAAERAAIDADAGRKEHDSDGSSDDGGGEEEEEEDARRKAAVAVRAEAALARQAERRARHEHREAGAAFSSFFFWLCAALALLLVIGLPLAFHHDRGHGVLGDIKRHILGMRP